MIGLNQAERVLARADAEDQGHLATFGAYSQAHHARGVLAERLRTDPRVSPALAAAADRRMARDEAATLEAVVETIEQPRPSQAPDPAAHGIRCGHPPGRLGRWRFALQAVRDLQGHRQAARNRQKTHPGEPTPKVWADRIAELEAEVRSHGIDPDWK